MCPEAEYSVIKLNNRDIIDVNRLVNGDNNILDGRVTTVKRSDNNYPTRGSLTYILMTTKGTCYRVTYREGSNDYYAWQKLEEKFKSLEEGIETNRYVRDVYSDQEMDNASFADLVGMFKDSHSVEKNGDVDGDNKRIFKAFEKMLEQGVIDVDDLSKYTANDGQSLAEKFNIIKGNLRKGG